jgi:hypothetical protein
MRSSLRLASIVVTAATSVLPAAVDGARPDAPRAVFVRALDLTIPAARTYFIGEHAGDEEAVDFRVRLVEAGARNVNLFLPDRVIVCDLPATADLTLAVPPGFERARALDVESGIAYAYRPWSWIAEAYRNVDEARVTAVALDGARFEDVVITIPPDRAEEVARNVEKGRSLRGLAPREENVTEVSAGSSFLGGSVLANFVFPESNGTYEDDLESWTDADLTAAKQGASEAMISWQGEFPKMDLSFVFRFDDRVDTGYEPITHTTRTDPNWVIDVLRTLGYGQTNDMIAETHQFNQERRAVHRTQWVFSAFIACSRNTPGHRFGSGTADYTAYAFLGGPCMVEPYPAGTDVNGVGERLVYSQIVNHEAGHCFWTLDEYPGAPGSCSSSSGYLNYSNGNLSTVSPGGDELRCNPLQECIMHTAARKNLFPRPWCGWSRGHLGAADNNGNGWPDIFEARPLIEFSTPGYDTVTTNQYVLRFRVTSQAVPNRNPNIAPDKRVSYALPLRRVWLSLNPESRIPLEPLDGGWGETTEDFEFPVQLAQSGASAFALTAENAVGYPSLVTSKVVQFIGVNYTRTAVTAKVNRNDVTWEIAGDPFGAKFDVYRAEQGTDEFQKINTGYVPPSGPPRAGFIPYRYEDRNVVAGRDYRYFVKGRVWLAYEDSTREYPTESRIIEQTAMIPIADGVISNVVPNPSRGAVTFSVAVPRLYGGPPTAPVRQATPVNVSIYAVNGERVRSLRTGSTLDDVITLDWDGTNEKSDPVPSGVYFVRASAGSHTGLRKIVLIR